MRSNLKESILVAFDDSVDSLDDLFTGLAIDVDAMAVLRTIGGCKQDLKNSNVLVKKMGKCKGKGTLQKQLYSVNNGRIGYLDSSDSSDLQIFGPANQANHEIKSI